jgi:hypothetical protein
MAQARGRAHKVGVASAHTFKSKQYENLAAAVALPCQPHHGKRCIVEHGYSPWKV